MSYAYVGEELELFAEAINWKRYFAKRILPFIGPRVLEVGAGYGGTTRLLNTGAAERWLCLEPDKSLSSRIVDSVSRGEFAANIEVTTGTLRDLETEAFDTILYIDVLEHIEADADELQAASKVLAPGGHIVVLSPAHQWLFSEFDTGLGHYRRYTAAMMGRLPCGDLELCRCEYLDSVGLLASAGNRFLMRQSLPTRGQIRFWDRVLVRGSRLLDPLLGRRVGKSILAVWRRGDN